MKKFRLFLIVGALALPTAALAHAGYNAVASDCACDDDCPLANLLG